jgi:hypothetical protein
MTNSELLLQLDRAVPLNRRQAVYLAFNTAIVDKLLAYHAQGKTEAIRAILEDIDQK